MSLNKGRNQKLDIERQALAKNLIIHFHLHVLINNHWLENFSRYCLS